jgi:hypothetical protein
LEGQKNRYVLEIGRVEKIVSGRLEGPGNEKVEWKDWDMENILGVYGGPLTHIVILELFMVCLLR